VLEEALDAAPASVIAAAGGVVLAETNRRRLRVAAEHGGVVVWLQADPALLATRVSPGDHRPLLASDPGGTLARMEADRKALYDTVADAEVLVGDRSPEAVAEEVLAAVDVVLEGRQAGAGRGRP
jgi:shikimate kinase